MNVAWPKVRLGEVLRRSEITAQPDPEREYSEITVRLWGNGVVERGRVEGSSIAGSRRFVAQAGQFIVSRIDARNGAMGIVPSILDGALVSNDFPLFNPDGNRIDTRYLGWISRTANFVDLCKTASEGTTNRVRLKEDRFLALEIHLPPLAEQQRIVARIEALAGQIREAQGLRHEVQRECEALYRAILISDTSVELTPMGELVSLRAPDVSVRLDETYQFAGVYSFGRGVFRAQAKSGAEFAYPKLSTLKAGNFTYPKLMAWEGALGVVPPECDGCVVSTEFPVFEVNTERVLPEVLDVHFRNPNIWPELAGSSTGTNVRRRRLNPQDFLRYKMPLPSMQTQLRLRSVMQEFAKLNPLYLETGAELDALLPAILAKAFRGDL